MREQYGLTVPRRDRHAERNEVPILWDDFGLAADLRNSGADRATLERLSGIPYRNFIARARYWFPELVDPKIRGEDRTRFNPHREAILSLYAKLRSPKAVTEKLGLTKGQVTGVIWRHYAKTT